MPSKSKIMSQIWLCLISNLRKCLICIQLNKFVQITSRKKAIQDTRRGIQRRVGKKMKTEENDKTYLTCFCFLVSKVLVLEKM